MRSYEQSGHRLLLLRAYRARAHANQLAGETDLAETDLKTGIAIYELLGERLSDEEIRLALVERMDEIFDEMISFQITARHRPDVALAYADRARTKVLPGAIARLDIGWKGMSGLSQMGPEPLAPAEIQHMIPAKTVLVQFSVLSDRLLIWVIRRTGLWMFERLISREALQAKLARFFDNLGDTAHWQAASGDLYTMLIEPWRALAKKEDLLVFVPDKELNQLPYAGLWDKATRRYLTEDYLVTLAPSATIYLSSLYKPQITKDGCESRALMVGDPAFDRELFGSLRRLPYAASEATQIAGLYRESRLLIGKRATKSSFLHSFGKYGIIHFAGHSLSNASNPLLSLLVMAPSDGNDSGALYARDIYSLKARRTRLIVLAGCQTAGWYVPNNEGASGIARAFLAAGVPTVIATLWDIDDRAAAKFLYHFHDHLSRNGDAAISLRETQLSALRGNLAFRAPSLWSTFEVFGAATRKP